MLKTCQLLSPSLNPFDPQGAGRPRAPSGCSWQRQGQGRPGSLIFLASQDPLTCTAYSSVALDVLALHFVCIGVPCFIACKPASRRLMRLEETQDFTGAIPT